MEKMMISKIMEGLRLLCLVITIPIHLFFDLLGTIIGMSVRAFKEGYQFSKEDIKK